MGLWLDRSRQNEEPDTRVKEHSYVRLPSVVFILFFLTTIVYGSGSIYWIIKKDNELEKSRRIELELRNSIKERDYVIQQFRQQIKQLERRVEILDAVQELSSDKVSQEDRIQIAYRVDETSEKYGQDPFLILAIMSTESTLRPWARSSKGARGLMQLMPSTGRHLSRQVQKTPEIMGAEEDEEFDVPHYLDIEGNIELGTLYLTQLMLKYKSLEKALYAYNLGPTLYNKRQKTGGPYPRKYLGKVMKKYLQLIAKYQRDDEPGASRYYSSNDLKQLLAQAYYPTP